MIFRDSRYASGDITKAYNPATNEYPVVVYRVFPLVKTKFFMYQWHELDRIDNIALKFLGQPYFWWRIMDYNPEILNPMSIPGGTLIRIPNDR
jgi:hypothetical protein